MWILMAPQYHAIIGIVALVCLGLNIATYRAVKKILRSLDW